MDLFGFVKDVGRKLFNKDEEAAEKIRDHILASNPGVEDLEVTYDNGIVGLTGRCTRPDAFQKCVLMAGNVEGVVDVYASGLRPFVAPKPEESPVGGPHQHAHPTPEQAKWHEIFEANREVIQDPDKIFPGQKIRVPLH
jgi:hypothetical protein